MLGQGWTTSDSDEAAEKLRDLFDTHARSVFFGGAGVSTASGIPDFRSADGLYSQRFAYPPETMLSHSFYEAHPADFFAFYRERMIALDAQPNQCHRKLAELERSGKLDAVVTQNIDGLHQACGSCADRCIAISASAAGRYIRPARWFLANSRTRRAFPVALHVAGESSRMSCCTRNRSTKM